MKNLKKIFLSAVVITALCLVMLGNVYASNVSNNSTENSIGMVVSALVPSIMITTEEGEETVLDKFEEITEDELMDKVKNGLVTAVTRNGDMLYISTSDGGEYRLCYEAEIEAYLMLHQISIKTVSIGVNNVLPNIETKYEEKSSSTNSFMSYFYIFSAAMFAFMIILRFKAISDSRKIMASMGTAGTVTEVNTKKKDDKSSDNIPVVKFDDVEGIDELKKDISRLVNCLKNTEKYQEMGARIPKGVILYGPPGTGKTLLAKAIAGEAGVPFFSVVGSDFVEKYVGVGAQRVRDLYKKARKSAPCIVFIDEVDAIARQRGSENNSEGDNTINALLAELDGFNGSTGIITICATNRLDMLDSAFKRAGRFDLKLAVGLPDRNSRYKILQIHGKNKKFAEDVDLNIIAGKTIGFSGAELEALLNEAALLATDRDQQFITYDDIDDAFFKIVMQGNKKPRSEISRIQYITAYHEGGHTLVTKLLTNDGVPSVTIMQSSSGAGGVTFRAPPEEGLQSREYIRNTIKIMYAGRAAEEIYLGDPDSITTGASNDIKQATQLIQQYIGVYGMGDLGMLDITQFSREFNNILEEASQISKELYEETVDILRKNRSKLDALALALVEKETLYEDEIDKIIIEN